MHGKKSSICSMAVLVGAGLLLVQLCSPQVLLFLLSIFLIVVGLLGCKR